MVLGKDSNKPWGKWDLLLAQAYQILEDERCGQCGLPRYICHNESNDIQFRIIQDTCAAKVEIERHEERASRGKKNYEPPKGTTLIPEPYMIDGRDFTTLREPFYKAEAEKREAAGS